MIDLKNLGKDNKSKSTFVFILHKSYKHWINLLKFGLNLIAALPHNVRYFVVDKVFYW